MDSATLVADSPQAHYLLQKFSKNKLAHPLHLLSKAKIALDNL
jgi:hypothetical protein